MRTHRRRWPIVAALTVAVGTLLTLSTSLSFAAPTSGVAELTIYSDGSAIGTEGSVGVLAGHSFISVRNTSKNPISVGTLNGIGADETVTVGTWGNKKEHAGIWYNLESYFVHQRSNAYSTASLTRTLGAGDLAKLNAYIIRQDSYNVVTRNCSTFASGAWNSVVGWNAKLFAGAPNTPTGLFDSITKVGGVKYGESVGLPWTSRGVWRAEGARPAVRSTSYTEAAPRVTFDDVPLGTVVTDQYASVGAVFSGDPTAVTMPDGSNPTAPVLSPGPDYRGTIDLSFVRPGRPSRTTVATNVAFDIGYMDTVTGATITWYAANGRVLGQTSTNDFGIVRVTVPGPAARMRIDTRGDDAGAAIDNLSFTAR